MRPVLSTVSLLWPRCKVVASASIAVCAIQKRDIMSSDAEDASSDPNFNGEHDDLDNMADSPKGDALAQKTESNASASSDQQNNTNGQKPNPKDPLRPRRKKARRACFACQRAHLTCGMLNSSYGRERFQKANLTQATRGHVSAASKEDCKKHATMACGKRQNIFTMHRQRLLCLPAWVDTTIHISMVRRLHQFPQHQACQ